MSIPAQGAVGAETMTAGQSLDLRDLHAANIARQAEWCPDQVPDLSFRGNELGGECGEAQNVIKKLERERQGWRGSRATKDDLADELADVVICADLCAVTADIDLGAAVRRKFNATSEKQGLSVFLPLPALASPGADSDERTAGAPDELTETEIRGRAAALISAKGWAPGETLHFKAVLDLMTEHGMAVASSPPQDRCTHPACGCDADSVCGSVSATPAQPAGAVPDSLRALSEAATPGPWAATYQEYDDWGVIRTTIENGNGFHPVVCSARVMDDEQEQAAARRENRQPRICGANASLIVAAVNRLREEIASHPAGQSAGSGAEARTLSRDEARLIYSCLTQPAPVSTRTGQGEAEDQQSAWARAAETVGPDKPWWWDKPWTELGYGSQGDVQAWFQNRDPLHRVVEPDSPDRYVRLHRDPRPHMIAARPAAPEAQGADDLAERLRREIGEIRTMAADPENKAAFCELTVVADNLEAILAAPPASSGQGGR